MADDRFGDIKIDNGPSSEGKGPEVPLLKDKDTFREDSISQHESISPESKDLAIRRDLQKKTGFRFSLPSRKIVLLSSIIPLILVLYGVSSYFLVPVLLKNLMISDLSQKLDRPVEIGRIVFSPFTLDLHFQDILIGPVNGLIEGKDLLIAEKARFKFSPGQIIKGKLVCRKAVLDGISLNLVRNESTKFDLLTILDVFISRNSANGTKYWPSWLYLDEVNISEGTVHIDDRLTDKVFSIEQIEFYLPSADTRELDKTALPKLTAAIDSSPFEINSVRFQDQSGAWRTGFSFEFKKVIVGNFKELLSFPVTGLKLTEGEADVALDIILPENQYGPEQIVIEGKADLRAIRWHDPETGSTLDLPSGRLVYQFMPADNYIKLNTVEFNEPELHLSVDKSSPDNKLFVSFAYLQSILRKFSGSDQIIEIENFLWNNGKITLPGHVSSGNRMLWNDVSMKLRGFTTDGFRKVNASQQTPASYTFMAKDISVKPIANFISRGQINAEKVITGKVEIIDVDLVSYPTLVPKSYLHFQEGTANISFNYEFSGTALPESRSKATRNKIYGGTLKTTKFKLNRQNKEVASGDILTCRNFYFDMPTNTVTCDRLELDTSTIHSGNLFKDETTGNSHGKSYWQLIANNLEIKDSTILIPIKGSVPGKKATHITLKNAQLQGNTLQNKKVADNFEGTATIGKKGKLKFAGSYSSQTKKGDLQLDVNDLHLSALEPYFTSWFIPNVKKGYLSASGKVILPEKEFKGNVVIDDMEAGDEGGAQLSWRRAFSYSCAYRSSPLKVEMEELVFQQPVSKPGLSNGNRPLSNYLRLNNAEIPPAIQIKKVRVEDGTYAISEPIIYPGYQPLLHNVNGTFSPYISNNNNYMLEGEITGGGSFRIHGDASFDTVRTYELDVQEFPLQPFDTVLQRNAGFHGDMASATWEQSKNTKDNVSDVVSRITVKDVSPDPASTFFTTLSMIIDQNKLFEMKMDGQYSQDRQQPFLLEQLIKRLRHLQVKAAISPRLVMRSAIPDLDLPENVLFQPGSILFDDSVPLENYKELLKVRPFSSIYLQGMFDPVKDKDVLQAEMQKEADHAWEIENKRRALEKVKILQEQKRRIKELEKKASGVVSEEIPLRELTGDLEPLSRITVHLDPARLLELSEERMKILRVHMVEKLHLDPARVFLELNGLEGPSGVAIKVRPYFP